jgi:hypothetical protein
VPIPSFKFFDLDIIVGILKPPTHPPPPKKKITQNKQKQQQQQKLKTKNLLNIDQGTHP